PPLARGYRGADRALQGGGVDGVNNAGLLAGGAFELEPEARRAGREQRRARAEHDRRDGKVIFVDQAEGGQGLRELAAAVDDDLLAGAGLQRVDALLEIAPEDAGIGPAWFLERGRDDDLFLLVDAPGDGIVPHRPEGTEPFIGRAAEENGARVVERLDGQVVPFIRHKVPVEPVEAFARA